jgi:tetratricopeptide (TPR) repeat protein
MDYRRALATARTALSRYPNDLLLLELEALLQRRLGQWDSAIAAFRQLAEREPSHPTYAGHLAESLMAMRRYADVVRLAEAFERQAPANSYIAEQSAWARAAAERDPEVLRRFLDTWGDRLDADYSLIIEQWYLRDSGRTKDLSPLSCGGEREVHQPGEPDLRRRHSHAPRVLAWFRSSAAGRKDFPRGCA